jgi:hypothetical protein
MVETKEPALGTEITLESSPPSQIPEKQFSSGHRDYAGAQAKTDLKEIRLVRKLDYRVMVGVPNSL